MATTNDILKRAISLIEDEDSWIKGKLATDSAGYGIYPENENACKFCAGGAILRAAYDLKEDSLPVVKKLIAPPVSSIPEFNDTHTHKEVLDWLRSFINA